MDCFAKTALPMDDTGKLFFTPVKGNIVAGSRKFKTLADIKQGAHGMVSVALFLKSQLSCVL